jgi:hypothetical protein
MAQRALELLFNEGYRYKKAGIMVSGIVPENPDYSPSLSVAMLHHAPGRPFGH